MTPNAIEILIHCHVCPLPHPRKEAPAVAEELCSMTANGLIEPEPGMGGGYRTTGRGRAHVEQLCQTAWPVQVWVGANGKRIELDSTGASSPLWERTEPPRWINTNTTPSMVEAARAKATS